MAAPTGRSAPIRLEGAGPYYRLTLPTAIHARAGRADLADLRVRDASGQAVPFAWIGESAGVAAPTSIDAPLFPVADAAAGVGGAPLGLAVRRDGTLVLAPVASPGAAAAVATPGTAVAPGTWIVDASRADGGLVQLRVELDPAAQGVFDFTLEAGDDLARWRPVADDRFVRLAHGGRGLERLAIPLDGVRARYLRLRWHDAATAPALRSVGLDAVPGAEPAAPLEWSAPVAPVDCTADRCDYLPPRGAPLESVALVLAMPNTLAPATLSSVDAARTPPRPPRNLLYAMRHGRGARLGSDPLETPLVEAVVYRIDRPGGEVRSPALALDGLPHERLRLRADGGVAAFGTPPPTLAFGVRPQALLFLARGRAPFTLDWTAPGTALPASLAGPLPLETLVPGHVPGRPLVAGVASVALPAEVAAVSPAPAAPTAERRPVWLWAALGGALALLGAMAWSLLRGGPAPDDSTPS